MKWLVAALGLASLMVAVGCAPGEETPAETVVAFEGSPDERMVAVWSTPDNASKYTMNSDGTYRLQAKVNTPGGVIDGDSAGEWRVNGETMLFKDQMGNVSIFTYALNGDNLTLTAKGSIGKVTELVRVKEEEPAPTEGS